jgi:hypothetical protein
MEDTMPALTTSLQIMIPWICKCSETNIKAQLDAGSTGLYLEEHWVKQSTLLDDEKSILLTKTTVDIVGQVPVLMNIANSIY